MTAKHLSAWRPISLTTGSLFLIPHQSQTNGPAFNTCPPFDGVWADISFDISVSGNFGATFNTGRTSQVFKVRQMYYIGSEVFGGEGV